MKDTAAQGFPAAMRCDGVGRVTIAAKLREVRSCCRRATVPFCASVISLCRFRADGVTSTMTSL